jgi:DNA sulfur modification protein DndE
LKSRTGITPNILCRIGLCLSLNEPGEPISISESDLQGKLINRFTLLGEYDEVYIALIITWMQENKADSMTDQTLNNYFIAHIHRGVEILFARARSLVDFDGLVAIQKIGINDEATNLS